MGWRLRLKFLILITKNENKRAQRKLGFLRALSCTILSLPIQRFGESLGLVGVKRIAKFQMAVFSNRTVAQLSEIGVYKILFAVNVIFDTSVWMAAIRSRNGASFALLRKSEAGVFVTASRRPFLPSIEPSCSNRSEPEGVTLDEVQIEAILAALAHFAEPVPIYFRLRPNLRDEGDNFVFECAAHFNATFIVTHNLRDFQNSRDSRLQRRSHRARRVFRTLEPRNQPMKTLQLRVPDSIHRELKQRALQEGVSLNQLLVVAASNEVVRGETRDFLPPGRQPLQPRRFRGRSLVKLLTHRQSKATNLP